ncbi:MAG: hypothetical protein ACREPR_01205 [Brasilonema sp.]
MNNIWAKLLLIILLFTAILAPFAGLAPLMVLLLGLSFLWILRSIVEIFSRSDNQFSNDKIGDKK